jgi:hypothetical protein
VWISCSPLFTTSLLCPAGLTSVSLCESAVHDCRVIAFRHAPIQTAFLVIAFDNPSCNW